MNHLPAANLSFPAKVSGKGCWYPIWRMFLLLLLPLVLSSCTPLAKKTFDLGHWNQEKIEQLQNKASNISDAGKKVAFISTAFLKTPYRANTLIGNADTDEIFVLRLDGIDCFTFLDYVEALRRSSDFKTFKEMLRQVRYDNGEVTFLRRHHFFSTWGNSPLAPLRDVTAQIGGEKTRWTVKQLNRKSQGSLFLPGYPIKRQVVAFIPGEAIDKSILSRLHSGDYIGIYSSHPGIDVSHTGIVIKKGETVFFRHASSKWLRKKVRDEKLFPYLGGKKGLIVYRPINMHPL